MKKKLLKHKNTRKLDILKYIKNKMDVPEVDDEQ